MIIRSKTLVTARWVAIAGQTLAISIAHYAMGLTLPVAACLMTVGVSVLLNIYATLRDRKTGISTSLACAYLSFDVVQMSLLLFLTGGLANPFYMLLLCPVAIGATILSLRQIVFVIFLSVFSIVLLAHFFVPFTLPPTGVNSPHNLILMGHFIAFSMTSIFAAFFGWRASSENRAIQKAHEAIKAIIAQKKHLNSLGAQAAAAAHELGSPLSTIAVAAGELSRDAGRNSPLADDIDLIISQVDRCKRILQKFGEAPDAETTEYILAPLPLTNLIEEIADNFGHENPGVTIEIEDHLIEPVIVPQKPEIVHSLGVYIQNAIQRADGYVRITCSENKDMVLIKIQDDGEGFDPEIISLLGQPLSQPLKEYKEQGVAHKRLGIFIAQNLLEELGARTVYSNDLNTGGAIVAIHWAKDKMK